MELPLASGLSYLPLPAWRALTQLPAWHLTCPTMSFFLKHLRFLASTGHILLVFSPPHWLSSSPPWPAARLLGVHIPEETVLDPAASPLLHLCPFTELGC